MNFRGRWGALEDGVAYFWKIAVPVTCFILLIIAAPYLHRAAKRFRKRRISRNQITKRGAIRWKLRRRKRPARNIVLPASTSNLDRVGTVEPT